MANKYVALLLVVCLVVAGVVVEARDIKPETTPQECYNTCYNDCVFLASICKWMCGRSCHWNPYTSANVGTEDLKPQHVPQTEDLKQQHVPQTGTKLPEKAH